MKTAPAFAMQGRFAAHGGQNSRLLVVTPERETAHAMQDHALRHTFRSRRLKRHAPAFKVRSRIIRIIVTLPSE